MKRDQLTPARQRESRDAKAVEESDPGLLNDIDDLLDAIDAVLEDQAVLIGFRQRSGE